VESIKGAFTPGDDIGFGEGMKNAFFPQAGAVDTTAIGNKAFTDAFSNAKTLPGMPDTVAAQIGKTAMDNAISSATAAAAPGFLRTYGASGSGRHSACGGDGHV
jgi:hypothetical protein